MASGFAVLVEHMGFLFSILEASAFVAGCFVAVAAAVLVNWNSLSF